MKIFKFSSLSSLLICGGGGRERRLRTRERKIFTTSLLIRGGGRGPMVSSHTKVIYRYFLSKICGFFFSVPKKNEIDTIKSFCSIINV